jgi:hypothetical protein
MHAMPMEEYKKNAGIFLQNFWSETLKERDRLEDPSLIGRIILKFELSNKDTRVWMEFIWITTGTF